MKNIHPNTCFNWIVVRVVMGSTGSFKQVSTLKRSAAGARTVTYEDEDTLADLSRDIEIEKRNQDKARQLSAEELATLSPVCLIDNQVTMYVATIVRKCIECSLNTRHVHTAVSKFRRQYNKSQWFLSLDVPS